MAGIWTTNPEWETSRAILAPYAGPPYRTRRRDAPARVPVETGVLLREHESAFARKRGPREDAQMGERSSMTPELVVRVGVLSGGGWVSHEAESLPSGSEIVNLVSPVRRTKSGSTTATWSFSSTQSVGVVDGEGTTRRGPRLP